MESVRIEKLVHGGQGIGQLADGRKVFVWNALPDELVSVRLTRKRRDYAEGIAEGVLESSPYRIEPRDEAYLSTSPWQVMDFEAENRYKRDILIEAMQREQVEQIPGDVQFYTDGRQWQYRNKMEYSFWADDDGLHLALFYRGNHGKRIVAGSSIAMPEIDATAHKVLAILNENGIRGSQLKTLVLRCNQAGDVAAALYVKDESFPDIKKLAEVGKGIAVCYSNPKSPASVLTRELYRYGDVALSDTLLGVTITYDVFSFFQVNLPVFETVLKRIDEFSGEAENIIDMYSGVGTIGVALGGAKTIVESDPHNIPFAQRNAETHGIKVVHATAEQALDRITDYATIIVDPPRAGLHADLVSRLNEVKPRQIMYLSCNPATQARDIARLQENFRLRILEGFNFFPRTPHIESLAVLERL